MTQPRLGNPAPVSLVVIQLRSDWSRSKENRQPNKFVKIWYRNMVPLWCSFNIHSDEKNELLSRRLKLWIPRMSTHTNIVTKYQSDRSYDLGVMRLGVPHVFFGPGGITDIEIQNLFLSIITVTKQYSLDCIVFLTVSQSSLCVLISVLSLVGV